MLFFSMVFVPWHPPKAPGPFVLLAVAVSVCGGFRIASDLRRSGVALKPGRSVTEITSCAAGLAAGSGFMLIGLILFSFFGRHAGNSYQPSPVNAQIFSVRSSSQEDARP